MAKVRSIESLLPRCMSLPHNLHPPASRLRKRSFALISLCDVSRQYEELKSEIDAAVAGVMASGDYILGSNVKAFEQEMCDYLGCKYAIGVNSGTDALHLALRAAGIGPGDEVITTPFTFIATSEAIRMVGATPVFADIELLSYNIDPVQIEHAITSRTRAILPVHLYGRPCHMEAITQIARDHNLKLIEDCAQSLGAKFNGQYTGTFGDAGCLSFFPSKNLGCMGDGGMIVTNSEEIYEQAEMLRRHGGKVKYHHTHQGINSRLDEIQAAILRVKLPRLDQWNCVRRDIARRYTQEINFRSVKHLPQYDADLMEHVFHQYTVLSESRNSLGAALSAAGIGNAIYYPIPLHLQKVNSDLGCQDGELPNAEYVAEHCISLPISPNLSGPDQEAVIGVVNRVACKSAA